MSNSLDSSPLTVRVDAEDRMRLLPATNDDHGGVIVDMEEPMDSKVFLGALRASMSQWKHEVSFINFILTNENCIVTILPCFLFPLLLNIHAALWQGKRGVWIKLPIGFANLVETVVKVCYL